MVATYYEVLEVPRSATAAELKSAFRKRIAVTHPDRTVGQSTEFRSVCAAWEVLRDPARRSAYDARLDLQFQATHKTSPPAPTAAAGHARQPSRSRTQQPEPTQAPGSESVGSDAGEGVFGAENCVQRFSGHWALVIGPVVVLAASAAVGLWWLIDASRVLGGAAGLYLVAVAAVLGMRWWGPISPIGIYQLLIRTCWVVAGLWAIAAAVEAMAHRDGWVIAAVACSVFALFGIAFGWLWHLAGRGLRPR